MTDTGANFIIHSAAELVTCASGTPGPRSGAAQGEAAIIEGGAVAITGGKIVATGHSSLIIEAHRGEGTTLLDASGKTVTPGLVDAHTHLAWAGWRDEEYEMRLRGATYLEIMEAGGGIMSTVRATRLAGREELKSLMRTRLERMLAHGTTTVEVKSGYGLTLEDELKSLRAIRDMASELEVEGLGPRIAATFLGAHAVPEEYADNRDGYVDLVVNSMLPAVAAEGLAEWCDAFCDVGAFTAEQTRRVLLRAKELGLSTRLHANEFARIGAVELAGELGCASADHLLLMEPADIDILKRADTIAVLLPGTPFGLGLDHYAPARQLISAGVPVALATDCNPGTCPSENLGLILALACTQMKMSPAEAIVAATINSACALNRGHTQGSLEPGKLGDIVVWDAPNHRHLAYHFGVNLAEHVFLGGRHVVGVPAQMSY
ncbi:MAG: imidazolonepropionase [Chloroflexota bacterium]|nr:imidazolonepropionase [Chloroflexota bacterium]